MMKMNAVLCAVLLCLATVMLTFSMQTAEVAGAVTIMPQAASLPVGTIYPVKLDKTLSVTDLHEDETRRTNHAGRATAR
jgi:hypothetical protein